MASTPVHFLCANAVSHLSAKAFLLRRVRQAVPRVGAPHRGAHAHANFGNLQNQRGRWRARRTRGAGPGEAWRGGRVPADQPQLTPVCTRMVSTVDMHHSRGDFANPSDSVGLNTKGLDKNNMPRSCDVMVCKKDTTLGQPKEFDAQTQVLDIPHRDRDRLLSGWLRPLRKLGVPHLQVQGEDGQGDGRQEDGGSPVFRLQSTYLQKFRGSHFTSRDLCGYPALSLTPELSARNFPSPSSSLGVEMSLLRDSETLICKERCF